MAYTGTIYRGVDYSPTWVSWSNTANTQFQDSDFANDAFASLWAGAYQAAPGAHPHGLPNPLPADPSVPVNNGAGTANYRNDLQTIVSDGFNLVRLYNWDMARGTPFTPPPAASAVGLDHLNFLNYANSQGIGLKIVVPVSDYFLGDDGSSWNGATPDTTPGPNLYSFSSAPTNIQADFTQFIASITDPTTGKIHAAIHSIDVGNEGDNGQGIAGTTASNFLARTNWWIYNLNKQINGQTGLGPDGNPVVANPTTVMITATFANRDQGGDQGTWFNDLVNGVTAGQQTPNGSGLGSTFVTAVPGLSAADPNYTNYYYNSFNVSQVAMSGPDYLSNGLTATLTQYDQGNLQWPGAKFDVPLMLMEVFTNNRIPNSGTPPSNGEFAFSTDQAQAAINQATNIEAYLKQFAGTTNVMGYNYFEFNDEPGFGPKYNGLYQLPATDVAANAQTGTTSLWYSGVDGFANVSFPVDPLTATPTATAGTTLAQAWTNLFGATVAGTAGSDKLVGTAAADTFQGAAGNDSIDGASGYDNARYGQNANGYTLKATAGSATITVQDKVGTDGTDTLTGVENVRFANGALPTAWAIATASLPATQVLKVVDLYTAGLGRAPDAVGLDYWASQLAAGASLKDISKAIFGSAEATPIYSPSNSNPVFVDLAYQTALGRAPDAAGAAYWLNELNTGHIQRSDFVTSLIAGARGSGGGAADAQYIANKEAVGAHFALTQGLNNVAWARAVEAAVNGTAASVTAANAQTDAFAAIAATPATSELVVQIVGLVP